jgi:hypothetical protein
MLLRRLSVVVLLFVVSAPAWAVQPNFNYLGLGYARQQLEAGCDQDGLFLEGSFALNEVVYAHAHHVDVTSDSWCGSTSTALSLGFRADMSSSSVLYGLATMINRDYGPDSDAGFGATLGARGFIAPAMELRGFISYETIDAIHETIVGVGLNFWFSRAFSLNGDISTSDENNEAVSLGLRFNFF